MKPALGPGGGCRLSSAVRQLVLPLALQPLGPPCHLQPEHSHVLTLGV